MSRYHKWGGILPAAGEVVVFTTKRLLFPSRVTHQKDNGPDVVRNSMPMLDSDEFYIKGGQELSTTRAARKTPVLVYLHKLSRCVPGTGVWFIEGLCAFPKYALYLTQICLTASTMYSVCTLLDLIKLTHSVLYYTIKYLVLSRSGFSRLAWV